jgi:uroporphyrinogen decarboxylase
VVRTLRYEPVDRAPRELWTLPGITMDRADEVRALLERFPGDFAGPRARYGPARRAKGTPNDVGSYTDAWGSVWHVAERGVVGEVKEPPLADWSELRRYAPPWELLDEADMSEVNRGCAETELFVKAGTETRPFERAQFLRGSEALFYDLAWGAPEVFRLLEMLHEFFCREMRMWAETDVDGVSFMDDWGAQNALLISPPMWREIFKPFYKDYCDILHAKGKAVFFHSDGHIEAIYPDLIEIGVDAVNSQLFCMDIEKLGALYGGKITFWGEIDRQRILPFGTEEEVRAAVRRVRAALDRGRGGVIAECEWGIGTPAANVAAVYDEWEKPR